MFKQFDSKVSNLLKEFTETFPVEVQEKKGARCTR